MAGLFEYSAAQTGAAIDSVFVYDFEDRIFSAYPVDSSETNVSESVIGKNNKGSLNRSEILYFDEFTETDTTILHRVSDHFDPMDYPFSAAVKIHLLKGDTLADNCSGIMISDYWMMAANHCSKIRETYEQSWSADSIHTVYGSPAFHNGTAHPEIGTIEIDKAVFLPAIHDSHIPI